MHESVMTWLGEKRWQFGIITSWNVLEVGSYNENGSARTIYEPITASYTGIDAREGRDVDVVMNSEDLTQIFQRGSYDLVICTEMLEHDRRPWVTIPAMAGCLRSGGHLLLTARGFDAYHGCYPEHPCPDDYWRFNEASFRVLLQDACLPAVEIKADPEIPGVFAHAVKP